MKNKRYNVDNFSKKFRTLRLQKNYTSIRALSKQIGIVHQTISAWETGKTIPTIKALTKILNFFDIDVRYFFLDNDEKFLASISDTELPFTETRIAEDVFFFLDHLQPGISVISYPGNTGITRTVKEYINSSSDKIRYFCGEYRNLQRYEKIIVDDADKLNEGTLQEIFSADKSIVLIGIDILDKLKTNEYIKKVKRKLTSGFLKLNDFDKIMENALPDIPSAASTYIKFHTHLNLKALAEFAAEIRLRRPDPGFKLDYDTVEALLS